MYNRSLLYVLICFCIDHQKHIIYFPFYFFPRHFFFTFFLFFCLFFSIIFIWCNFTKHTPWQYLRLTAMDDQAKAIHAYLQICFMIYPFFSLFYFYFLFLSRRYNFLLLYFSFSLSLTHSSLMNINYTHTSFSRFIYTCMYKDILLQWGQRVARFLFLRCYLSIYFCTFIERYMSKKMVSTNCTYVY